MNPKDAALRLLNAGKKKLAQPGLPRFALMFVLAFGVQAAMAAGGFDGPTSTLEKIRDTVYTVVGILAGLALLGACALGFMGKKDWPDVLKICMWIIFAGGAIAFAAYLFTQGGKMKFS
jgi:trbC/VIRB2 family